MVGNFFHRKLCPNIKSGPKTQESFLLNRVEKTVKQLLRHKTRSKILFWWIISRPWRNKIRVGSEVKAYLAQVSKELLHRLRVALLLIMNRFSKLWQIETGLLYTSIKTQIRRRHILRTLTGENEQKIWWIGFSSCTSFRSLRRLVLSLILKESFRPLWTRRIMSKRPASLSWMLWKTTRIYLKIENRHPGSKMSRLFLRLKSRDRSWTKDAKSSLSSKKSISTTSSAKAKKKNSSNQINDKRPLKVASARLPTEASVLMMNNPLWSKVPVHQMIKIYCARLSRTDALQAAKNQVYLLSDQIQDWCQPGFLIWRSSAT